MGFSPEIKSHSHDITHCLFQGIVTFKPGVGIDIRVYFHINIVKCEQTAQRISHFNTPGNFLYLFLREIRRTASNAVAFPLVVVICFYT